MVKTSLKEIFALRSSKSIRSSFIFLEITCLLYILLKAFLASFGLPIDMVNLGVLSVKIKKKPSKLSVRKKRGNPIIIFIINT